MLPHRRPRPVSRDPRSTLISGSASPFAPPWAGIVALLLGLAMLGTPVAAEAASAQRQAATARPAKTAPARPAAAVPARPATATRAAPASHATATRAAPARHAARHTRRARSADTAAFDDRAFDDRAFDDRAVEGRSLADRVAAPGPALAQAAGSPRAACLAAARQAERTHGLPDGLMVAVALSESGLHAHALNIRGRAHFPEDRATARALVASAGGRGFAGCVQISLGHARGSDWPLDPVQATDWAGALMARAHAETGSWTAAVARFHGGSPRGSQRVICRVRAKLEAAAPGSPVLRDATCGGDAARERRNGAALLEIAEAR